MLGHWQTLESGLFFIVGTGRCGTTLLQSMLSQHWSCTKYVEKVLYERHLPPEQQTVCKFKMQKIERKYLTLRTRIKRLQRKSICYSRSIQMHDLVIGLYINKYEFGLEI